jgi:hypothetical protein
MTIQASKYADVLVLVDAWTEFLAGGSQPEHHSVAIINALR